MRRSWILLSVVVGLALVSPSAAVAVTVSAHGSVTGTATALGSYFVPGLWFAASDDSRVLGGQSGILPTDDGSQGPTLPSESCSVWYAKPLASPVIASSVSGFIAASEAYTRHKFAGSFYDNDNRLGPQSLYSQKAGSASIVGLNHDVNIYGPGFGNPFGLGTATGARSKITSVASVYDLAQGGGAYIVGERVSNGWRLTCLSLAVSRGTEYGYGVTVSQSVVSTATVEGLDLAASSMRSAWEVASGSRVPIAFNCASRSAWGYARISAIEAASLASALLQYDPEAALSSVMAPERSQEAGAPDPLAGLESPEADSPDDVKQLLGGWFSKMQNMVKSFGDLFWFVDAIEEYQ